jgi:hypothetical protein
MREANVGRPRLRYFLLLLAVLLPGALMQAAPARAMTYSLAAYELASCQPRCPSIIVAEGMIGLNEEQTFLRFIRESFANGPVSNLMLIHSEGGYGGGGVKLGYVLRRLKMSVGVGRAGGSISTTGGVTNGYCLSACVFVLAGGTKRFVLAGSKVGVHSGSAGAQVRDPLGTGTINARIDFDQINVSLGRFYQSMGVSAQLAALGGQVPSEKIYLLSPQELVKFRVVNGKL